MLYEIQNCRCQLCWEEYLERQWKQPRTSRQAELLWQRFEAEHPIQPCFVYEHGCDQCAGGVSLCAHHLADALKDVIDASVTAQQKNEEEQK